MSEEDEGIGDSAAAPILAVAQHLPETRMSTAMGIASLALSLAMKYHDINTVQDGQLYQQYKLEGKNLTPLHLDHVFETAMRIELHLLASEKRIASLVAEAIFSGLEQEEPEDGEPDDEETKL